QRMMQRVVSPLGHGIRIGPALKQKPQALPVVPVGFAQEQTGEAERVQLAAFKNDLHDRVVVGFRDMVGSFLVVGSGPALEQQAREAWMPRNACRAIDRALPQRPRIGLIDHLVPARVRTGAGIEERPSGGYERIRAPVVEPEIARVAETRERVPTVRTTCGCGIFGIAREKTAHACFVCEYRRSVDAASGNLWVARQ